MFRVEDVLNINLKSVLTTMRPSNLLRSSRLFETNTFTINKPSFRLSVLFWLKENAESLATMQNAI